MANEKRLIDANAIKYRTIGCGGWGRPEEVVDKYDIEKMPTVDAVEVVHGRWKAYKPDCRGYTAGFICSCCGDTTYTDYCMKECEYDYCPNCGAKMDGDGNG